MERGLTCDLCGGTQSATIIDVDRSRALRSDRVIVNRRLLKVRCLRCGLVRSGDVPREGAIAAHYRDEYETALSEHVFYDERGPRRRSAVVADWLAEGLPGEVWTNCAAGLEFGAGAGLLLAELRRRFPGKPLIGFEPNRAAAAEGRKMGLDLRDCLPDAALEADVAWSIAVLEHVSSPTEFLRQIRASLRDRGWLVLIQPTADVPSYDVLFVDHLHHFGGRHLAAYAQKCGFELVSAEAGHPLMPNFSRQVWRRIQYATEPEWEAPVSTACEQSATKTLADMARLDATLRRLAIEGRRVAAFGLHEVYALARAYSILDTFPLVCGLDDQPERYRDAGLPFPIVRPEEASRYGTTDVLLTMNALYYRLARRRCAALGLICHTVLDEDARS